MNPVAGWPLAARATLAAALGVAGALGLQPYGMWPLSLLALAAVPAQLLAARSPGQALLTGWAFGAGWFALALAWIVEPFFVDAARHGWLAPFAIFLMAAGGGAFWAVPFWAAKRFAIGPFAQVWLLIAGWSLAEFARAYLMTGFPWAALAQIWVETDMLLLLAWIGPQGLAVATLVAALVPGLLMTAGAGRMPAWAGVPAGALPLLVLWGASVAAGAARPPAAPSTGQTVRLVQPNAPQDQKWDPAYMPVFFDRMIGFTAAGERPDLIVWPESAVPVLLDNAGPALERIAAAADGVPVVLGIQRDDGDDFFNSLVVLDGAGKVAEVYDKHHLVPFGEYVPMQGLADRLGLSGLAARLGSGYGAGPGPRVISLGRAGRAVPLICYEAVFPQDVGGVSRRADLLLQITNDAWFGKHSGPYQHLAQARMRAVEQGLPMVRAANTGVSAVIDPWGRVTVSLPLDEAGYADASLPAPRAATLYARTGDLPAFILVVAGLLILIGQQYGRRTASSG